MIAARNECYKQQHISRMLLNAKQRQIQIRRSEDGLLIIAHSLNLGLEYWIESLFILLRYFYHRLFEWKFHTLHFLDTYLYYSYNPPSVNLQVCNTAILLMNTKLPERAYPSFRLWRFPNFSSWALLSPAAWNGRVLIQSTIIKVMTT